MIVYFHLFEVFQLVESIINLGIMDFVKNFSFEIPVYENFNFLINNFPKSLQTDPQKDLKDRPKYDMD